MEDLIKRLLPIDGLVHITISFLPLQAGDTVIASDYANYWIGTIVGGTESLWVSFHGWKPKRYDAMIHDQLPVMRYCGKCHGRPRMWYENRQAPVLASHRPGWPTILYCDKDGIVHNYVDEYKPTKSHIVASSLCTDYAWLFSERPNPCTC